jgi:hypothetical protein
MAYLMIGDYLLTGDGTLNVVAMNFAGVKASWREWVLNMGVHLISVHINSEKDPVRLRQPSRGYF